MDQCYKPIIFAQVQRSISRKELGNFASANPDMSLLKISGMIFPPQKLISKRDLILVVHGRRGDLLSGLLGFAYDHFILWILKKSCSASTRT
jgi:hypothetical protein